MKYLTDYPKEPDDRMNVEEYPTWYAIFLLLFIVVAVGGVIWSIVKIILGFF